jgi:long-chain fatty acid transport protein
MTGLNYINTQSRVTNSGVSSKNDHDDDFLPTLFANYHIPGTDLTVGLGSYTPFGLATSYDEESFTRFAAIRSQLKTLYVTPSIAWRPVPYLSIGGGMSFVHSSALLSRKLFLGAIGIGEGRLRITDTDDAYAYNIGIVLKPHQQIKLGLTYRSRVALEFDRADVKFSDALITGGASTSTKATGINVPIPPVINAGVQWQVTPSWKLELDYNFTRWSEFNHLKARFKVPLPALGGAVLIPGFMLPQDWKDTSTFRAGTAYAVTDALELRTGFSLDQSPIPDRTLNPTIPGANILTLNGGIGYRWNRVYLDLSYMAIFYEDRRVKNNSLETGNNPAALPFPGVPGRDKYEIFQNFVAMNLRYQF